MIETLISRGDKYFLGTWYSDIHSDTGKTFRYALLNEPRKVYGTVINNLILTQGRTTIKTNWNLGWEPQQIIIDNFGDRWKIEEVVIMPLEVNQQVSYFARNPDIDYVLSLVKIGNPLNKK